MKLYIQDEFEECFEQHKKQLENSGNKYNGKKIVLVTSNQNLWIVLL